MTDDLRDAYAGMDLRGVAANAMRERDQLRAEVAALRERAEKAEAVHETLVMTGVSLMKRAEAAEAEVERLRAELDSVSCKARGAMNAPDLSARVRGILVAIEETAYRARELRTAQAQHDEEKKP